MSPENSPEVSGSEILIMETESDIKQLCALADQHIQEGRHEEGISIYKRLVGAHPADDSLLMSLTWAYKDSGKAEKAVTCLETLLERELRRAIFAGFAFDELVRIYIDDCHYERLVSMCERVVAAHPDDASLLITLGDACLRAGKRDRAIQVFELLSELEPDSPMSFCYLGNAHIAAGSLNEGWAAYEKAILIDPSDTNTFYDRLGFFLSQYGHCGKAEEALRKSIEINRNHPATHCTLGDILIKQDKVAEGMASYENAVRLDPTSQGSYYNRLGNVLTDNSHHRDARAAYRKAIAADPENPFYYLRLAESYKNEGFDGMADEIYKKAKTAKVAS